MTYREIVLTDRDRLDDSRRSGWTTWLTRHGINPDDVSVPGWICCEDDPQDRCIWVEVFHRGNDGTKHMGRDCPEHSCRREDFCTESRKVQLEAAALPFPEVILNGL